MAEENEDYQTYGVPRDFYTSVKWLGMKVVDIVIVVGAPVLAMQFTGSGRVFPQEQVWQYILFVCLTFFIALFLVLPHNGGKNNFSAIRIFVMRRRRKYLSIGRFKEREGERK